MRKLCCAFDPGPPPEYSISTMLVPMAWIKRRMYCLPVKPIVKTRMSEADPMTMPREVSMTRTLLARKLSMARLTISLSTMVRLALASCVRRTGGWLCGRLSSGFMVNGPMDHGGSPRIYAGEGVAYAVASCATYRKSGLSAGHAKAP